MTTRHTWIGGAALALALANVGCDDGGGSGGEAAGDAAAMGQPDAAPSAEVGPDLDAGERDVGVPPDAGPTVEPCSASAAGLRECVSAARFQDDLHEISATTRPPGSPAAAVFRERAATELEALGYRVERQAYGTGVNVIGVWPGTERPAEQVLISAHYDTVLDCPGADDNSSGAAGVLEAARVLAGQRYARTLVVALWDEEEEGLVGSRAYAARAKRRESDIEAHYVLEMIGFTNSEPDSQRLPNGIDGIFPEQAQWVADRQNRADFIAFIGDDLNEAAGTDFEVHADAVGLPMVRLPVIDGLRQSDLAGDIRRSDHAPFWDLGYPAAMVTDTSEFRNLNYHCAWGEDAFDTLDVDFATKVVRATVGAAADQLELVADAPAPESDAGLPTDVGAPLPPACDLLDPASCPAGEKCSVVDVEGTTVRAAACVPAVGQVALGEACTRPDEQVGRDDCGPGLFCTFWALPASEPQARVCRALCKADVDCGPDGLCASLGPSAGACIPRCDPFGADCAAGTACTPWRIADAFLGTACSFSGPGADGDPCTAMALCGPGLLCTRLIATPAAACLPWCDPAHPCPAGRPCVREGRLPGGLGQCAPPM